MDRWYEHFFGEDYVTIYEPLLPPVRTAREVEEIVHLLALPKGAAILDLACGYGRHAIALAERGYRVTGQDLSAVLLRRAAADADARSVPVRWVQRDMRDIPYTGEFDAVISVFTSFGYLETDADDQRVLVQARQALKPGGQFLLETISRDAFVRQFQPSGVDQRNDGLVVIEERQFEPVTGRNNVRVTIQWPDGRRAEHLHSVRVYCPTELGALCQRAGLPVERWFGGLDGSPLDLTSRRPVLIGRRSAGEGV